MNSVCITSITLDALEQAYQNNSGGLEWNCPFVLPFWLKNWWQVFGIGKIQAVLAASSGSSLLGVAPLMIEGHTAKFLGSESVCDYQDMVMAAKCPDDLFLLLLAHLKKMDVRRVELGALRPDSKALHGLSKAAEKLGAPLTCEPVDRLYELELPKTWEGYLGILSGKQRHEVRRKIRRFSEAGQIDFRVVSNKEAAAAAFEEFLLLFQSSSKDKSGFLTVPMASFFRSLAKEMAVKDMLRLGFLSIDGTDAASTFCFEYANTVYLYNNGYLPRFRNLSAGSLGKIFSIKHTIEKKIACYDFLKGDETYKKRLGGRPISLYRLTIDLKQ